jgi:pimeloyl-ACP methyl ester carboxylesterase
MSTRMTIDVDGRQASYLTAGERGPIVLLLHGTYWSRVWQPVLDELAAAGLRPVAVDLPGLGRSEGELTVPRR